MEKIVAFVKKETVLSVAWILALGSMFVVNPSMAYVDYIDFRSLGILWSLMIIIAGVKNLGFFDKVGQKLLKRAKNSLQLTLILVFLCFFTSMFITNDVALLTFVPFAMFMLDIGQRQDLLIPVIALQTLAANLGSMLTPIGNPQNLYLYGLSNMNIGDFVLLMLPYSLVTFALLLISGLFIRRKMDPLTQYQPSASQKLDRKKLLAYALLFFMSILVVLRVFPYYVLVIIVLVSICVLDRTCLLNIDYALLFTFVGFFIFTGNLGQIQSVKEWLMSLVGGHEVIVGVIASQFISNVPAALLLSDFTQDIRMLLVGVNLGGLGTLIASMASLISFKLLAHAYNEKKGRYLLVFSFLNIIYLAILLLMHIIIHR